MSHRLPEKDADYLTTPEKKRAYNQALFSVVARKYHLVTRVLSWGRDRVWKKRLTAGLPRISRGIIVDLACGTGDLTVEIAKHHSTCLVIGIDVAPAMLEMAKPPCSLPNVHLVVQDMHDIGIRDRSADLVTGGYALRNAPDIDRALDEIYRILKPGGKAFFLDFSKDHRIGRQRLGYAVLKAWGSMWGLFLHGNPEVYGYIAESLKTFPDRRTLRDKVIGHGFADFHSTRYFRGLIESFDFEKPLPSS